MNSFLTNPKLHYILLILISGFIIFFNLGEGSLWDWDEAIYASVAKDMFYSKDYLSLTMNGTYWPEKPPLIIWCITICYHLFGISEFSARLPVAVFGLLTIIVTYHIGKTLYHHWIGLIAAGLLLATIHFLILARMAMLDVPLIFFMSIACYFYLFARNISYYFYLAGCAVGLAVMTKGPIGFFPFIIMGLHMLLSFKLSLWLQRPFWRMILISLIIAMPWHMVQIVIHGQPFIDYYFVYNLWARSTTAIEDHSGTFFFYIKYIFEHFFTPWLILSIIVLFGFGPKLIKNYRENKTDLIYFLLIWFLSLFLFFSLTKTKVAGYIAPCYVPLALITAKLSWDHIHRLKWFKVVFILFMVVTASHLAMVHPLQVITIDKSQAVKELAVQAIDTNRELIVVAMPVNAPIFYFDNPVIRVDAISQLTQVLLQNDQVYLLCEQSTLGEIRTYLSKHYNCQIIKTSQNNHLVIIEPVPL